MRFVTGHDFSRAASAIKSTRALAPEGRFSGFSFSICPFSAACSGPEERFSAFSHGKTALARPYGTGSMGGNATPGRRYAPAWAIFVFSLPGEWILAISLLGEWTVQVSSSVVRQGRWTTATRHVFPTRLTPSPAASSTPWAGPIRSFPAPTLSGPPKQRFPPAASPSRSSGAARR